MAAVTSADGTTIGYDQIGQGPPLILVAGATQHRAVDQDTPELARRLAERFTVLNYDRRGHPYSRGEPIPDGAFAGAGQPALVIAGGESPEWMRNGAAVVADVLANGELRTLPGQTHDWDPDALAPVMLEFLGGVLRSVAN